MKRMNLEQPLVPSVQQKNARSQSRLKRKRKVHKNILTFETTYYIDGQKHIYDTDKTLEETQEWVDAVSKGTSDIRHYSEQLKALVDQQAADYLASQASAVIAKYYDYGTSESSNLKKKVTLERNEEIRTEEQKQLHVAIHQVEARISTCMKGLKTLVRLLRQKVFLLQKMIDTENNIDPNDIKEDEKGLAEENVSSIGSDLRMISNQYHYALRQFSDSTNEFLEVQLSRENRFKNEIYEELVRQRNVKIFEKLSTSGNDGVPKTPILKESEKEDEKVELKKLASQIMNFASHESKAQVAVEPVHAEQREDNAEEESDEPIQVQTMQTVQPFPSYKSSHALREYAVESYYQAEAAHRLEVMTELTNEVLAVERSLLDLRDLLFDLSTLIRDQSALMNDVFLNMQSANEYVERTVRTMKQTKLLSQESRRTIVIMSIIFLLLAGAVILILNRVLK